VDCRGIAHQMFINLQYCASVLLEGSDVKFSTAFTINGSVQCEL